MPSDGDLPAAGRNSTRALHKALWVIGGVVSIAVTAACLWIALVGWEETHLPYDRRTVDESKRRGDAVIAALEAHRRTDGRYPRSLDELEADGRVKIEQPTAGTGRWEYFVERDGSSYLLKFEKGGYGPEDYFNCSWNSKRPEEGWCEDW